MPLAEPQARIDQRLHDGGSLAEVEEEILDPAPLSEEQRAGLWFYASATLPRHVAEAVVETAQRSRPRLSRMSTALRSAAGTAVSRTRKA